MPGQKDSLGCIDSLVVVCPLEGGRRRKREIKRGYYMENIYDGCDDYVTKGQQTLIFLLLLCEISSLAMERQKGFRFVVRWWKKIDKLKTLWLSGLK